MVIALSLFFVAIVLMLGAVLSVMRARRVEQVTRVNQRLEKLAFLGNFDVIKPAPESEVVTALSRWLMRVGIPINPAVAILIIVIAIFSGLMLLKLWGPLPAIIWWSLLGVVAVFIPQVRYRQKINKMLSQIPLFIDQVIRGLATGRNVEGAIKLAAEELKEPLREVLMRAQKGVEAGADLGEALRDAATFHDVKELHMLALAIHTSRVYGGSPREMLESIVNLIRQREQMQRELRAMTGETRMSAWVLGALPSVMALYMVSVNPNYIIVMWNDPGGQRMLFTALGLQVLGALTLWRMVKSI